MITKRFHQQLQRTLMEFTVGEPGEISSNSLSGIGTTHRCACSRGSQPVTERSVVVVRTMVGIRNIFGSNLGRETVNHCPCA
jgi:hypothetical protein